MSNIIRFPKPGDDDAMEPGEWEQGLVDLHERLMSAIRSSKLDQGCRIRLSIDEVSSLLEAIEFSVGPEWFDEEP
jgi:hypothetical protein